MLAPGAIVPIDVEKPAAGGRMIGRVDGQVVLIAGAIPGERVRAQVERIQKNVVYATTVGVERPSPDRRPAADLLCGGSLYGHIDYPRQLAIKAQVIADAFLRIGRVPLPALPEVAASAVDGYRMRARLHVRNGRIGFFREGTHHLCDARATRQLLDATCDALEELARRLPEGSTIDEIELAENLTASGRVFHVGSAAPFDAERLSSLAGIPGVSGLTAGSTLDNPPFHATILGGSPYVSDTLTVTDATVSIRRHVLSFFQGNRHLLPALVRQVTNAVPAAGRVVDLYAGAGLFAIPAAVARVASVTAVEGDRVSSADLLDNAKQASGRVETVHASVEAFTARPRRGADAPDVVIVDPPRTGMSKDALTGAIGLKAARLVYVSCDVATLARDARRLLDAGYGIDRIDAYDLFPNTPHVETVVRFDLR
jgi:23S rRNA (uracil1939-C5)-methyltransferase